MICECNNTCGGGTHITPAIRHVFGNVLRIAIPLTLRTLMKDGDTIVPTDTDFIPSSDYPVNVIFGKGNKNIAIQAEMDGNVAIIEERGKMPVGTYDITVECRDELGQPYRFKKDTVLQVVDVTAEAGIEPTIEYEAETWYLDAAIFLATTEISSMSEEIERRLEDVFGEVEYDAENKEIKFYDKNKTHVLGTLDSTPFVVDGTVDDVYIDVGRQVLVVVLNEDAGGRRFSVPLYLVFENYYKKSEVDERVNNKADVLGDGRLPGAEAVPVVIDYFYAPSGVGPVIPINPQAGEVVYFASQKKIRRYYYEDAGQSGGLPAVVYVEETPSRYVVYYNKGDEKFYRYDAGSSSMVEIETGSGGGEGTVTGVKVGSTTYEPTDGVVDISAGIPDVSGFATSSDVADAVADLVDSAPATLDTLNELAAALGDDPNFATTMTTALGNKVDKVTGKGLSTEDYTTAEKTKLAGIASGAEANVQADWEQTTTTADDYIKNKPDVPTSISVNQQSFSLNDNHAFVIPDYYTKTQMDTALAGKQDTIDDLATIRSGASAGATAIQSSDLATVATTGAYSDLSGKPSLATVATSGSYNDLSNKPNLATVATSGSYNDLSNKPTIPAAQVNADWNASSGVMEILNKPTIPTKFSDLVDDSDYIKAEDVASIVVGSADVVITETASHICITFVTSSITFTPNTTMSLYASQKTGTLTVSGTHLKQDITLAVPSGFTAQVSGGTAAQSITIPQTGGEVSGVSVTITYTGADSGSYTGSITATSGSTTASVGLVYSQYQGATIIAGTIGTINAAIGSPQIGELNVSGANLEGNITASVGNGDFTICATRNGTYGNSAIISKSSAEASGGATLFVKYTPSSGTSTASGTLTLTTPRNGVNISKTVNLTGAVVSLTVSESSLTFNTTVGTPAAQTFTVKGANLTQDISISVSGTGFSVSPDTIDKDDAGTAQTVTVTYSPSTAGTHTGEVTIQSSGVSKTVTLQGTVVETPNFTSANNYRLQVNGIYYDVMMSNNAPTTNLRVNNSSYSGNAAANSYAGDIVIPSTISGKLDGVATTFTVKDIRTNAFSSCSNLNSVVVPDTVTAIHDYAFYGSSLKRLVIGNGVVGFTIGSTNYGNVIGGSTVLDVADFGTAFMDFGPASSNNRVKMSANGKVYMRWTGSRESGGNTYYHARAEGRPFTNTDGTLPSAAKLYVPSGKVSNYQGSGDWAAMFSQGNILAIDE